jgi:hypothetical protein
VRFSTIHWLATCSDLYGDGEDVVLCHCRVRGSELNHDTVSRCLRTKVNLHTGYVLG